MAIVTDRLFLAAALCVGGIALSIVGAAAADDVTGWDGDGRSGVRMIAGAPPTAGARHLRAGVEIRLTRGWHTYWRYPGDSGVPPLFNFAGSGNLQQAEVLWPAPARIADGGGTSIGYLADVIFPVRVVPHEAGKPVALRLKVNYAICENLCVQADARSELILAGGRGSRDGALTAAEGRVPKPQALGEGGDLAIRSVRREPGSNPARAVVDVAGPASVDLFVEGPTPQWALPVPTPVDGAPAGTRRFTFELDGAPAGERYEGALLTFTAVAGGRAIEVTTRLD